MKTKSRFTFKTAATLALIAIAALAGPLHAGSLWKDGITDERGMFADKRAKRVGDIVTVIVQESASVSNTLRALSSPSQGAAERSTGNSSHCQSSFHRSAGCTRSAPARANAAITSVIPPNGK